MKLYNTLTRKKEEFTPISDVVKMYACGPTVYSYAHIGNMRTFIFKDLIRRTFKYLGYKVFHAMNITDVGHLVADADLGADKMEKSALSEGKTVWEIAEHYTKAAELDFTRLNIEEADVTCKATDHIKEQIDLVKVLEEKGYTYKIEDGIYFDTSKFATYCDFARIDPEALIAGARVKMAEGKKNITDFALWKFSPKDQKRGMEWDSPWGIGFPGWHIECSAMALKYLGETFDIHCGGMDLVNIHHSNEIAQSEAATGKKFVNYWLHGEFLIQDKAKMAKSKGGYVTVQSVIDRGINPLAYRYLTLSAHYRNPLNFSWEILENAVNSYNSLLSKISELKKDPVISGLGDIKKYRDEFLNSISDDLNMPRAIAVVWKILKDKDLGNGEKLALILEFDVVLALSLDVEETKENNFPEEVKELAEKRFQAKADKDWAMCDTLRDKIKDLGYVVKDGETEYTLEKI